MLNYDELSKTYLDAIETYLDTKCFCYEDQPQTKLFEAMRYSLLAGGKRLRPIFVLDFCRMCGGEWKKALPFAAAMEMIHTYSLIHDDLPCMDDDDLRRGRPTNHKVFGEATAVLAGDALLTAAFSFLADADFPAETRIRAVKFLSYSAGELGMVGGQMLDMTSEQRECTAQEVMDIQSRKTGDLIRAACMLGVLAGQGSEEQLLAALEFATHLGIAFQIRDDMLDVIGNREELGKAVGTDSNKNTLVRLYGLEACNDIIRSHTDQALACLSAFKENAFMATLAEKLTMRTV